MILKRKKPLTVLQKEEPILFRNIEYYEICTNSAYLSHFEELLMFIKMEKLTKILQRQPLISFKENKISNICLNSDFFSSNYVKNTL